MAVYDEVETGLVTDVPQWGSRQEAAVIAVRSVLAKAEENYLAEPGLSLGTWLARVEETISVAARAILAQIEHQRLLIEEDVAIGQAGLFADICAESIRAVSRLPSDGSGSAKDDFLELVAAGDHLPPGPGWDELQEALLRCQVALEPIANGLREGDLPMDAESDHDEIVSASLLEVARWSFGVVYALCG